MTMIAVQLYLLASLVLSAGPARRGHRVFFGPGAFFAPVLIMAAQAFSVPGTSSTANGYDNEGAYEPMCWVSTGYDSSAIEASEKSNLMSTNVSGGRSDVGPTGGTPWDNELVKGFYLTDDVRLLRNCPSGVDVSGDAPAELTHLGQRLRTGLWYNYTVRGSFDLSSLDGDVVSSDNGAVFGVQIILCELGRVGLCTPFTHEHANARLEAEGRTVPVVTGDRHGGTHVHSPTVLLRHSTPPTSGGGVQEFEAIVKVLMNDPGHFFAIAAFQVFTADQGHGGAYVVEHKYDISNALETRLISYYAPAEILRVSNEIVIVSAVLIAVGVGFMTFLLQQVVTNLNSQVMTLSQGPFLVVFLASAIVGTVSSFLFNPVSDLYCIIDGPMVFIPITLMYAIVIGRLWRINAVISPLLSITLRKDKERVISSKCFALLDYVARIKLIQLYRQKKRKCGEDAHCKQRQRKSKNLRRKVTSRQLARVIFLFTLPQIILQICSLSLQPDGLDVHFNEDESIGRADCRNNDNPMSIEKWSIYYLIILFVAMLGLAHESRALPSLFNETRSIYDSVLVSILIVAIGLAVIYLSDSPTTSPEVEYILKVIMILSMSLNTTLRIMCPKLKLMWSNQSILVSKLVSDQHSQHSPSIDYASNLVRRKRAPYQSTIKYPDAHQSNSSPPGAGNSLQNLQKQLSKWRLNVSNSNRKDDFDDGNDARTTPMDVPSGTAPAASNTSSIEMRLEGTRSSKEENGDIHFGITNVESMEEGTGGRGVRFRDGESDGVSIPAGKCLPIVPEKEPRRNTAPDLRRMGLDGDDKFDDNGKNDDDDDDESIGLEGAPEEHEDELSKPSSTHSAPSFRGEGVTLPQRSTLGRKSISERHFDHLSSVTMQSSFNDSVELATAATSNRARHLRWRLRNRDPSQRGMVHAAPAPVLTATSTEIRISDFEAPARRLMLRMIDIQELLERVNRQVMTGLVVSHEEWDTVREACMELGDVFRKDVKFEWDELGEGGSDGSDDHLVVPL